MYGKDSEDRYETVKAWAAAAAGKTRLPPRSDRMLWSEEAKVAFCIEKAKRETAAHPDIEQAFGINLAAVADKIGPDVDMLEDRVRAVCADGDRLVDDFRAA